MRAIAALAADTLRRSLTACVVLVVAYSLSPAAVTQLHVNPVASGSVRGVYRFSSTAWSTIAGLGFNWVTDGGANTNYYPGQKAAGP